MFFSVDLSNYYNHIIYKNEEAEKEILAVLSHHGISKIIASIATCNLAACRGSKEAADSLKRYDVSQVSKNA